MRKLKVVIIGGGFGGVKAALELCEEPNFSVTLISNESNFIYNPTLYHTATGGSKTVSSIPLRDIFSDKTVSIVHDEATKIDKKNRRLTTKTKQVFDYDALIIAIGVKTNYFGIKGLEKYAHGIKSLHDAEALKYHLHDQMTQHQKLDKSYIVVGGGPTGVELAAELPDYIRKIARQHGLPRQAVRVSLVEAAPRILPSMPKDISKKVTRRLRKLGVKIHLKSRVLGQTADGLKVNNRVLESRTVIWTAGTMNHPFFQDNDFQLAKNHRVRVDQFLQAEPGIYVIGDNADTPYSGMAQTALYDAHTVAKNLIRLARGETPQPYKAKQPVYAVPVGSSWAAVLWGKFRFYGRLGWLLRRSADLVAYKDYLSLQPAIAHWLAENEVEDACIQCADKLTTALYRSGEA